MSVTTTKAPEEWYEEVIGAVLRVAEGALKQQRAEAVVALREVEYRHAVERWEAAGEQVESDNRLREAVRQAEADQAAERRQVEQERFAGAMSPASLEALQGMLSSAGVVMRDRPTPTVLTFLREKYIPEKLLEEDARRHMQGYVRLFARVLGDRPLNSFTRADILNWVRTLERIRTSYGKSSRDAAKSVETILKESKGKPTLNATTIGKHLTHIKGFFLAAIRHYPFAHSDGIEAMFADVRLSGAVPPAKERVMWPLELLSTLMHSPMWTGTRSNAVDRSKRHQAGDWVHLDAYWWLPVMGLHTGARLEELAQLQHPDLMEDSEGRLFLNITNEGDRRLKNERSKRPVPLHPFLVELGLPALFRKGGKGRIFPELKQVGRPKKWGGQFSEDFTAYRRAVGLYAPLRDFHALRHTVISVLRKTRADLLLIGQLVGHQDDPELRRYVQTNGYSHFSVADRAELLALLDWGAQGVDLSHIKRAAALAGGPRGLVRAADLGLGG